MRIPVARIAVTVLLAAAPAVAEQEPIPPSDAAQAEPTPLDGADAPAPASAAPAGAPDADVEPPPTSAEVRAPEPLAAAAPAADAVAPAAPVVLPPAAAAPVTLAAPAPPAGYDLGQWRKELFEANPWLGACEARLQFENDMLPWQEEGDDDNYTQGARVRATNCFGHDLVAMVSKKLDRFELEASDFGFQVGQNIYTPRAIHSTGPAAEGQRPYAAWFYAGVFLRLRPTPVLGASPLRENATFGVGVDVGRTGPDALGDEVQNGWHDLIKAPRTRGWDHQIESGTHANLQLEWTQVWFEKRLRAFDEGEIRRGPRVLDFSTEAQAVGPLPWTRVGLGVTLRLGRILGASGDPIASPIDSLAARRLNRLGQMKDFSLMTDERLDGGTEPPTDVKRLGRTDPLSDVEREALLEQQSHRDEWMRWEAYWFARGNARWVPVNELIEGRVTLTDRRGEADWWVADAEVGVVGGYRAWRGQFGVVWRTPETKDSDGRAHVFWALHIAYVPRGEDPQVDDPRRPLPAW